MPVNPICRIINTHKFDKYHKEVFMIVGITEKEYNSLKHGDDITIKRGEEKFDIVSDNVLCFGEIDFREGSDDCKELDTFDWLDNLSAKGICIPSRYNYNRHECVSPTKKYLWTETFRNSTLCRYLHGCIGKPQFTLIFREIS